MLDSFATVGGIEIAYVDAVHADARGRFWVASRAGVDGGAELYRSDDGGLRFTRVLGLELPRWIASCGRTMLLDGLRSDDGGETFQRTTNEWIERVAMATDQLIFGVRCRDNARADRYESDVLVSHDGARTFRVVHTAPHIYDDVGVLEDGTVIVAGSGDFIRSTDGGRSWQRPAGGQWARSFGDRICCAGPWVYAVDQVIRRSRDAGDTWFDLHAAPSPAESFRAVHATGRGVICAVGAHTIAFSLDDGASFARERVEAGRLSCVTGDLEGRLLVGGERGPLLLRAR